MARPTIRPTTNEMAGHSIDGGNIQFIKQIGVGTYGDVYSAIDHRTQKMYAVKILPRSKSSKGEADSAQSLMLDARKLAPDIAIYVKIPPHRHIAGLERVLHTRDQLFLLMEYCGGGDLYENISSPKGMKIQGNDALIRKVFLQLIDAISHCHRNGVYHRDLKPENILLTADKGDVKLIDFGLATDQKVCRDMGCGSAYYMSPECQRGVNNDLTQYSAGPSDVWSLGIILINLTTGRNPWNRAIKSDNLFARYIENPSFLFNAVRATPHFRYILRNVLQIDPTKRCTLDELYAMVLQCQQFVYPPDVVIPPSPIAPVQTPIKAPIISPLSPKVLAAYAKMNLQSPTSGIPSPLSPHGLHPAAAFPAHQYYQEQPTTPTSAKQVPTTQRRRSVYQSANPASPRINTHFSRNIHQPSHQQHYQQQQPQPQPQPQQVVPTTNAQHHRSSYIPADTSSDTPSLLDDTSSETSSSNTSPSDTSSQYSTNPVRSAADVKNRRWSLRSAGYKFFTTGKANGKGDGASNVPAPISLSALKGWKRNTANYTPLQQYPHSPVVALTQQ